ncbi:P-loop containing nucleoside triphosphate hydrolase protein [Gloeophyllum trabeum ATCC 11539]|uniref:p-loop containing nucleoside triphosphate hydrolase protein n=1 Tax=Gloeophyllum trabeum (strain ATCC 11539 / FP-39264 / Madison 617) TaxID=670483 RepID=S7QPE1_GLOTA|nr:P-loop containing nucleoside triphosphate hydrolase protein [Gloeophyllum trabeum ATCC 11539]EPQ61192.1 P-loop containing nucleoside triphosphate hydrolase protein [Gloeophyllum trabeum ATCC 11539]
MARFRKYRRSQPKKGSFDPDDETTVKHTKLGIWDLYEEIDSGHETYIPVPPKLEEYWQYAESLPYVWHMMKDILALENCRVLLILLGMLQVSQSLLPALSLWFSSQLLTIVQVAVDTRAVDKQFLLRIAAGRIACAIAIRVLSHYKTIITSPLQRRIKQFYSLHIFHAMARLDVPTFEDTAVQRQLEATYTRFGSSVAWEVIQTLFSVATVAVQLVSQVSVLVAVMHGQAEGPLISSLALLQTVFEYMSMKRMIVQPGNRKYLWAATTKNEDYIRMEGMKRVVNDNEHRKELVAGNLAEYLTDQYRRLAKKVGDNAMDFNETKRMYENRLRMNASAVLQVILRELPLIAFSLRAVQYPASIPLSLASLNLIRETVSNFSYGLLDFVDATGSIGQQLSDIRKLYEVDAIPNKVPDGSEPFPENDKTLESGVSVEFRNVSFKYPGSDKFALRHVSFYIGPGQLCVIVGSNGSGKSTILKLISRIYDPVEGEILIDGRDIKTLLLADLRRRISVLFQDYTHFPLSIKENIALGNPELAHDEDKIREAARLGGAEEFIKELPEGMDTYLTRPVRDYYAPLPEGTKTLFGRSVDYTRLRGMGRMKPRDSFPLSGGQMQRLAVSRTFMRSLLSEASDTGVGLLLFDEPSASLDPTAEHDLFERLRQLRGHKTMLFSSHRFGNLTRHADILLYINDSSIKEAGTHEELLKRDGEYARIWNLQAQAFLS